MSGTWRLISPKPQLVSLQTDRHAIEEKTRSLSSPCPRPPTKGAARLRTPRTFPFCARGEPRAHFPNPRRTVSRDLGQGDKGRGAEGGRRRRTNRTRQPLGRGPRAGEGRRCAQRLGGRGDGVGDRCETLEEERRGRFRLKSEKAPETRQRETQTPGAQEGSDLEHTNKTTTATVRCPRSGERGGDREAGPPRPQEAVHGALPSGLH